MKASGGGMVLKGSVSMLFDMDAGTSQQRRVVDERIFAKLTRSVVGGLRSGGLWAIRFFLYTVGISMLI